MYRPPYQNEPKSSTVVISALCATAGSLCLLSAVAALFVVQGPPFGHLVKAEAACKSVRYESERKQCVDDWIAAERQARITRR